MRLYAALSSGLGKASFEKYVSFNPSPLSLKQLLEFGELNFS